MIEIRPALAQEMDRVQELWGLAFGDDAALIQRFYQLAGGETLLLFEDGVAWTMTVLLPVTLSLPQGTMASSAYVYALCTHPQARGRGYGQFLLRYVDFYLKEKGLDSVTVVPAQPSLHAFFAAAGFSPCFAVGQCSPDLSTLPAPAPGDGLEPVAPGVYNRLREEYLSGRLHVSYGGGLLAFQDFLGEGQGLWKLSLAGKTGLCALEYPGPDSLVAKELLVPDGQLVPAAALLAARWPGRRLELRTPDVPSQGGQLRPFGMVKWFRPQSALDGQSGYMGLGFD